MPILFNEQFDSVGHPHQILESTTRNGGPQVRIKAIMQTTDTVNKNKRIYPKEILMRAVDKIKPMIEQHALTGELDHPVPTQNSETDSYRHFVVLYQNTSHIIENLYFEGNKVMGIVKTASTAKGRDLAGLILDGVPVGFSLRGMGESEVNSSGITTIKEPFEMITYDAVSNPSHKEARMQSRVSESQIVVPPAKGKLLMENTFGALTMDRTGLLYSITKNKSKTLDQRLRELSETINNLKPDPEKVQEMFRKKSIVGLLEAYLNDDKNDVSKSYHNSMVEYLTDYFDDKDKRKTNRDKARKDLLKKHFNIDTEDIWKDSYKDYLS